MATRSPKLASLNEQQRKELEARLLSRQRGRCFICDEQIDVILGEESGRRSVEMIVRTAHAETFVAHERGEDLFASVDLVVDKLERQLTRHKERYRNRKHAVRKPPERAEG